MTAAQIIIKPIITEKTASKEADGVYVFKIHQDANKIMVKHAVNELYGVLPESVRILYTQNKVTQRRGLKKKSHKRAIVQLPQGKTIDLTAVKKKK